MRRGVYIRGIQVSITAVAPLRSTTAECEALLQGRWFDRVNVLVCPLGARLKVGYTAFLGTALLRG